MKQQMEELKSKKCQKGFTLIELIMVIVILGILAAVAVPQFVDLSGDAEDAAVASTRAALVAAMRNNAAMAALPGRGTVVTDCAGLANIADIASNVELTTSGGRCVVTIGSATDSFEFVAVPSVQ